MTIKELEKQIKKGKYPKQAINLFLEYINELGRVKSNKKPI